MRNSHTSERALLVFISGKHFFQRGGCLSATNSLSYISIPSNVITVNAVFGTMNFLSNSENFCGAYLNDISGQAANGVVTCNLPFLFKMIPFYSGNMSVTLFKILTAESYIEALNGRSRCQKQIRQIYDCNEIKLFNGWSYIHDLQQPIRVLKFIYDFSS